MDMVAIGRVVLTNREHIIALEPLDQGLMGTLLRYQSWPAQDHPSAAGDEMTCAATKVDA